MAAVYCCCCCIITKIWPCLAASCCWCRFFKASSSARNLFSFSVFPFRNSTASFPLRLRLVYLPYSSPAASDLVLVSPNRSTASSHFPCSLSSSIFFRAPSESLDSSANFSRFIISSIKVSSSLVSSTAMPLAYSSSFFFFFQVLLLKPFHPFYKDSLKEFHNTIYPHIHDTLLKMRSRSYESTKVRKPLCTLVRRMEIPQSESEHCFDDKISTAGRLKGERTVKLFY